MRGRLDSLTGLRAFAALAIVAVHSSLLTGSNTMARLSVGVGFFFVLSGFVLAWSWDGTTSARTLWWRRIARVYPAYLLAWACGLLLTLRYAEPHSFTTVLSTLTLTQAWIPRREVFFGVNGVAWSLSCEAFFYLLLPALLVVLSRLDARRRTYLAVTLAVLSIVWIVAVGSSDQSSLGYWATYICPLARLPEFVLGILAAQAVRDGWRVPLRVAGPLAIVATAATWLLPDLSSRATAVTTVPFLLLIAAGAGADITGRVFLADRLLVKLGEWSYALYLLHQIVYRVVAHHLGSAAQTPLHAAAWTLAVTAVAIGLSAATFELWERPAERRLRSWGGPAVAVMSRLWSRARPTAAG